MDNDDDASSGPFFQLAAAAEVSNAGGFTRSYSYGRFRKSDGYGLLAYATIL